MTAPVSCTVELFLNATWTDVTTYVQQDPGIDITFGVQSESGTADPSTATLVLNNFTGRFTPKNAAGAYYPYFTRGTPVRIKTGSAVRFSGEVSDIRPTWNENANYAMTAIVASGLLRRLARATSLDSNLVSGIKSLTAFANVVGYWPCEDAVGSTAIASELTGGAQGVITGSPVFEAVDPGVMSRSIPTWKNASCRFTPTNTASATEFTMFAVMAYPTSGMSGGEQLIGCEVAGTLKYWRLLYTAASGGGIILQVLDSTFTEIMATAYFSNLDGTTFNAKLEVTNNGANVDWALSVQPGATVSGSLAAQSVGAPSRGFIGGGTIAIAGDCAIGQFILCNTNDALFDYKFVDGWEGYAGESVNDRMARLDDQTGITINVSAGMFEPIEMGVQQDGTLLDAIRQAEKADAGGILTEDLVSSNVLALRYVPRTARYNDTLGTFALNYSSGHLRVPLEPVIDDSQIRNDVKVNREGGASARAKLTSGALSSANYPAGVGPYQFEDTYGTYLDSELQYLAQWVLALGTIDETRFPQITIDLVKNSSLVAAWETVRPGWSVTISNLPTLAGAASVNLQVVGWREFITPRRRLVTLNCVPGDVWHVFELDDTVYGKLDDNRLGY